MSIWAKTDFNDLWTGKIVATPEKRYCPYCHSIKIVLKDNVNYKFICDGCGKEI